MYFSINDLKHLIEQAEKVKVLQEEVEQLERRLDNAIFKDSGYDYKPEPTKIIKL